MVGAEAMTQARTLDLAHRIAAALDLAERKVAATLALLDDGATVPFLARYRKEQTGGLDEVEIAAIQDHAVALRELDARRAAILASIDEQGKLTPALRARIEAAATKTELEDLYLPYRPKRRTRATAAREAGYEPLADLIWAQGDRLEDAADAIAARYGEPAAAWQGARDIVAERVAEDAGVRAALREQAIGQGVLRAKKARSSKASPEAIAKFADYVDHAEPVAKAPSHRVLALNRAEAEKVLSISLEVDRERALGQVRHRVVRNPRAPLAGQLEVALVDGYDRLLEPAIDGDVRRQLTAAADAEAIRVFAANLRELLMAPPLGAKRVLALDPGFRTGCKLVALDETGALVAEGVIYPHEPHAREAEARRAVGELARHHRADAIAIGNGTAGRETLAFVRAMKAAGELPADCAVVSVNESGASIYSASAIAREEFPDKDVTVRGAVSIGRRLQDPLAELVKLDPKSIGVGQYQHDVDQPALKRALDGVVERCVNQVGVEVNTASASLLAYVAGIGPAIAKNIVARRDQEGPFRSRAELKQVPRLGAKAFEQAAGFLRVRGGRHPLDASAVHPESYGVVERMAKDLGIGVAELVANREAIARIDLARYVDDRVGEPTLRDIVAELEKPGRDPREQFEEVAFRDDVTEIEHLREGMVLEGVVTNVTGFGAFVDIGVHQDGLVHVSQLAHKFVKDPAEVVKVGDRIKAKVVSIDLPRRRIGLSIKQATEPPDGGRRGRGPGGPGGGRGAPGKAGAPGGQSAPGPFNAVRFRKQ
jgi:uncharacterized protein